METEELTREMALRELARRELARRKAKLSGGGGKAGVANGGPEQPGVISTAGRGIVQGLALNLADEIFATGKQKKSMWDRATDPEFLARLNAANASGDKDAFRSIQREPFETGNASRETALADYRRHDAAAMEANPGTFIGGSILGGIATIPLTGPASFTGNLARGSALPARMMATAKDGAVYGGLYGAGSGETIDERLSGGATGGLTGALLGGAIPAIGSGIKAVGKPVLDAMKARLRPSDFAAQKTAERLAADGMDIAQIERRMAKNPGLSVADAAGDNARNLLRSAINVPGPAQNRVTARLELRQMGQGERIKASLARTFADPDGYLATKDEIAAEAKRIAGPLYEKAYQQPVPFSREIEAILKTPAGRAALAKAKNIADNEQQPFMQWFANVADDGKVSIKRVPDMRAWDYIKRGLDDVIEGQTDALTGKVTTSGRAIVGLKNRLLGILDRENPAYREARAAAKEGFDLDDALEFGRKASTLSAEAVRRKFASFSEAEKQMGRIGYVENLRGKIDGAGWTHNKLLQVIKSPEQYRALRAMFPDQESFAEFRRAMMNEARKQKTFTKAQGNSTTAKQLMDLQDSGQLGENIGAVRDVATGNIAGFVRAIGSKLQRLGGMTPDVADGIAKRLMETRPAEVQSIMTQLQKIESSNIAFAQKSALTQRLLARISAAQSQQPVLQDSF